MNLPSLWIQSAVVIFFGTVAIVAIAAIAASRLSSAAWQKIIWQATTLALIALVLCELCGMGRALVALGRFAFEKAEAAAPAALRPAERLQQMVGGSVQAASPTAPRFGPPLPHFADPSLNDPYAAAYALEHTGTYGPQYSDPYAYAEQYAKDYSAAMGIDPAAASGQRGASQGAQPPANGRHRRHRAAWARHAPRPAAFSAGGQELPDNVAPGGSSATVDDDADAWDAFDTYETLAATSGEPAGRAGLLGLMWLAGFVCVAGRLIHSQWMLRDFRRRSPLADNALVEQTIARLAPRLGILRAISLRQSTQLHCPVAFGILHPTVVLPAGFEKHFDARQQAAMLAHELEHLSANDPLWQFVAGCVCAALWWHPLAWWASRQLRAAGERAADEASLLVPDGPSLLADCLVAYGRRIRGEQQLGWLSIEGGSFRSALGRRVERLLELPSRPWHAPGRGRLIAARTALPVALVVLALSFTAWAQAQAPSIQGGSTMGVLSTSWRCSLAATALWAIMGTASSDVVADEAKAPSKDKPAAVAGKKCPLEAKACDKQADPRARMHKHGDKKPGQWAKGQHQSGKHGKAGMSKQGKHGKCGMSKHGKHGKCGMSKQGKHGKCGMSKHGKHGKCGMSNHGKHGMHKHGKCGMSKHGKPGMDGKRGPMGFHGPKPPFGGPGPMGFHGPKPPFGGPGPMGFQGPKPPFGGPGPMGFQGPKPPFGGPGPMGFHGPKPPFGGPGPMGFHGPKPVCTAVNCPCPACINKKPAGRPGPKAHEGQPGPKADKPVMMPGPEGRHGPNVTVTATGNPRPMPEKFAALMKEQREIGQKLRELKGKLDEKAFADNAEVKELKARGEKLHAQMREEATKAGFTPPSPADMQKRFEEMKAKVKQLRADGKGEEADKLAERLKRYEEMQKARAKEEPKAK